MAEPIYDGGSAFPFNIDKRAIDTIDYPGMSLRDYFAAKAMAACVCADRNSQNHSVCPSLVAALAYEFADAMLAARKVNG